MLFAQRIVKRFDRQVPFLPSVGNKRLFTATENLRPVKPGEASQLQRADEQFDSCFVKLET